jgi:hypothetical protein
MPLKERYPLRCTVCDIKCTHICLQCQSAPYCSRACQKLDWTSHKTCCGQFTNFITTRPCYDTFASFYFSVRGAGPELIWVGDIDGALIKADVEHLPNGQTKIWRGTTLGDCVSQYSFVSIMPNGMERVNMDHVMIGCWRQEFLEDGSLPNISVRRFMEWKQKHDWRGPIIFMASGNDGREIDVTMKDLRIVRDFMVSSGDKHAGLIQPWCTFGREEYPENSGWVNKARDILSKKRMERR